jgi:hypothetical protein
MVIAAVAAAGACGGRSVDKKTAHGAILRSTSDIFRKEEVDVKSVDQAAPDRAVVEADVRAAFTLRKVQGEWVIEDVRLGRRPWEQLHSILQALDEVKARETRALLERVAEAVGKYAKARGSLPDFRDFVTLTDALHPDYLTPLVRLDAWRNPLSAFRPAPNLIRLLSAGPDGKEGTGDDIESTRSFSP